MKKEFELPAQAQAIIATVEAVLQPVYLVGGSVRDVLLGKEVTDYDFTTPLHPELIEQSIRSAGYRPYITGKRFGTVGFKYQGQLIEITTFRAETYEKGSRKPAVVYVDNITHDLSRRDFTINAMAVRHNRLIDPFHGREDLQSKTIQTVGQPGYRFREDPLRMLRAIRLASQLQFTIEEKTLRAIKGRTALILQISKERWVAELDKILLCTQPSVGLQLLAQTRLLHMMLPELGLQVGYDQNSPYHSLDLWSHTCKAVDISPPDITMRWAALLHDVGKPFTRTDNKRGTSNYAHHELVGRDLVRKIGTYLRWSNERIFTVAELVERHLDLEPDNPLRRADTGAQ